LKKEVDLWSIIAYIVSIGQHDTEGIMNKAMKQELDRLEALTDIQLYEALVAMENDPAPQYIKNLIAKKINSIFNKRIGLEA
jgi:hypothetical protein